VSRASKDPANDNAREVRELPRDGRYDRLPDVRDGLTRVERVILWQLHEAQKELAARGMPERNVASALLYGRVVEHVNISVPEFQRVLARLVGK
jgi:hypothetical protein